MLATEDAPIESSGSRWKQDQCRALNHHNSLNCMSTSWETGNDNVTLSVARRPRIGVAQRSRGEAPVRSRSAQRWE